MEGPARISGSDDTKQDVFVSVVVHKHQFSVTRSPRPSKGRVSSIENLNLPVPNSDSPDMVSRRSHHPYLRIKQVSKTSRSQVESSSQDASKEEGSFSHLELLQSSETLAAPTNSPFTRRKQLFSKSLGQVELNQEEKELRKKRQMQRRRRQKSLSTLEGAPEHGGCATLIADNLSPQPRVKQSCVSSQAPMQSNSEHSRGRRHRGRSSTSISPRQIQRKRASSLSKKKELKEQSRGRSETQLQRERTSSLARKKEIRSQSEHGIESQNQRKGFSSKERSRDEQLQPENRVDLSSPGSTTPKAQRHRRRANALASMQNGLNQTERIQGNRSPRTMSPRRSSHRRKIALALADGPAHRSAHSRIGMSPRSWHSPRSLSPRGRRRSSVPTSSVAAGISDGTMALPF